MAALGQSSPLLLGRILSAGLTLWLPLVLVRLLPPEAFGGYKQFFLVAQTAVAVGQMGLVQSLYYFLPRGEEHRGAYLVQAVSAVVCVAAMLAGLLWLSAPLLGHWLTSPVVAAARWPLALWVAGTLISSPLEVALIAEQRLTSAAGVAVISDAARAAALIAGAALLPGPAMFWIAAVVAWLRVLALASLLVSRRLPVSQPSMAASRTQIGFALPLAGSGVLWVAQRYFPQYAVSAFFGPTALALFSVASFHLFLVDIFFLPIADVLTVRLSQTLGHPRSPTTATRPGVPTATSPLTEWDQAVQRLALVFFPMTIASVVFAQLLVGILFTDAYASAIPLFLLVTLQIPLWALPVDSLLSAAGRTRWLLMANIARSCIVAAGVLIGIAGLGLPGALLGSLAAEIAARLIVLSRGRTILAVSLREVLAWSSLAPVAAAALIAGAPAWALSRVPASGIWQLVLGLSGYATAYCVTLAIMHRRYDVLGPAARARASHALPA